MAVCATPGCPTLVPRGHCDKHRKAKRRESDRRRPDATARGYDRKWKQTRKDYLRLHPLCEDESGCIEPATDVDHIDGQGPLGPKGHDFTNLRALCARHHSQRTARDQPGGWAATNYR